MKLQLMEGRGVEPLARRGGVDERTKSGARGGSYSSRSGAEQAEQLIYIWENDYGERCRGET